MKPKVAQVRLIEAWKDVPIGTEVIVTKDLGEKFHTKTRSAPWLLGGSSRGPGHTAVIMVEGISGCCSLERVQSQPERKEKRMEFQSDKEIAEACERLFRLLKDPHPGLGTWQEAKYRAGVALHEMLGRVLDAIDR